MGDPPHHCDSYGDRVASLVDLASAPPRDSRVSLRAVARGSAINFLAGVTSFGSTFALALALANIFPAADVGVFFTATSLFLLVTTIGQLGTNVGLVYFLARDQRTTGGALQARYLRVASGPILIVAGLTSLVLLTGAPTLAGWMGDGDPSLTTSLRVMAVFVIPAAVLNVFTAASRGLGTMVPTAVFDNIVRGLLQVLLVLAVAPLNDVTMTVLAWSLPYLPCAAASVRWWHKRSVQDIAAGHRVDADDGAQPQRSPTAVSVAAPFWRFTAPRALAGVVQMAMQRLDVVLVGALAGLPEAAIYAVATRFHVLGQLPGLALSRATQPQLAAALLDDDRREAARLYQVATCWLVLAVWPFYLTLMFGAGHLLRVFGEVYLEGSTVLLLLSAAMLAATGCGMVDNVLTMGGKTSWNLYNVLLAFGVNLILDVLLIPSMGIMGAAIGWTAAILCANLIPLVQVAVALKLHPFGAGTLTAMSVSMVCFGAIPGVAVVLFGDRLIILLTALVLALISYGGIVWLLRSRLHLGLLPLTRRFRRDT